MVSTSQRHQGQTDLPKSENAPPLISSLRQLGNGAHPQHHLPLLQWRAPPPALRRRHSLPRSRQGLQYHRRLLGRFPRDEVGGCPCSIGGHPRRDAHVVAKFQLGEVKEFFVRDVRAGLVARKRRTYRCKAIASRPVGVGTAGE